MVLDYTKVLLSDCTVLLFWLIILLSSRRLGFVYVFPIFHSVSYISQFGSSKANNLVVLYTNFRIIIYLFIDLVSHTTYVVCVNFIHKWRDLQFKVDSEWQIFWETFHGNFYLLSEFLPKICWEEIAVEILFVIRLLIAVVDKYVVSKLLQFIHIRYSLVSELHRQLNRIRCVPLSYIFVFFAFLDFGVDIIV